MGTIAAWLGFGLLIFGAPVIFLMLVFHDAWYRRSLRRDFRQYYLGDREIDRSVGDTMSNVKNPHERLAIRVLMAVPVGWIIAAILYYIYGP